MKSQGQYNTTWRKVASTIYRKPVDSKMLGGSDLDITELERFITARRSTGQKITMTHFFVMAVARALKTVVPELNTYVRRGKIIQHESIDVAVSVLQASGDMTSVLVPKADTLDIDQLVRHLNSEVAMSRQGSENRFTSGKNLLARLPWPFRSWFYWCYRLVTMKLGISIPSLGLTPNKNGSVLVTNIGSIGLDYGFPALLPTSNFSLVMVMGGTQKKPLVVNDKIEIRKVMSVTVAIDHRVADASHGAHLFRYIRNAVKNPDKLAQETGV